MAYLNEKPIVFSPHVVIAESETRLISSVTLNGKVQKIQITTDNNGQPFSLNSVLMGLKLKTTGVGDVSLRVSINGEKRFVAYRTVTLDNNEGVKRVIASISTNVIGDITESKTTLTAYNESTTASLAGQRNLSVYGNLSDAENGPITDITIYLYQQANLLTLEEGTTVEMWGC